MSESEAATSSTSEVTIGMEENLQKPDEFSEPETKRRKISQCVNTDTEGVKYKLVERLGGILCCAVCLDLPKAAVYQVSVISCIT